MHDWSIWFFCLHLYLCFFILNVLEHSISKKECHINEFPLCFTYNMYIVPSVTTTSKNPNSPRAWVVKFLMLATSLAFKVNYEDAAVPSLYNNESSSHTKLTQWSKLYIPSTIKCMFMLWDTKSIVCLTLIEPAFFWVSHEPGGGLI